MSRTLVIADAHGYPEVIRAALHHAGFEPGEDRLVFAGDFLDRGPDPQGCLDLVDRYADEVLLGNHDLAVLLDTFIWPQEPQSRRFRPHLLDRVLGLEEGSAWKAATTAEGVLITHAGVSENFREVFEEICKGEVALLVEWLNQKFREAVGQSLQAGTLAGWAEAILGEEGPFWFRPRPFSRSRPLPGVRQVAGHSPPLPELEEEGFYMIDPCAWALDFGEPLRFRYAAIGEGGVEVREGLVAH